VTKSVSPDEIVFEARGRLLSSAHKSMPEDEVRYHLIYRLTSAAVEIAATASASMQPKAPIDLIVPVISRSSEALEQTDTQSIRIKKVAGVLRVTTDANQGFAPLPKERTFNLVPGFECVPITIRMRLGEETRIRIAAS
jgi:hypothetical protein